ncbi:phage head morphogenesis protein [Betaproteobacteria bacterium]|nr:phage head morphogenesis protein [Betaproteobacteria bacterium]GHU45816.1 phage head morphogenesis protein [Betaproteobacteria bacterium]
MATADATRSPQAEFAYLARLAPRDAMAYLQGKRALTSTFSWQDLWQEEHAIQFTVSRMANMDILRAMSEGIEQSVNGDLSRRDWMRDMQALLQKEGWWGKKDVVDPKTGEILSTTFNASRLKLIFDTNTRAAYSVGHWKQAMAAKESHPYLRYITKGDDRVREAHAAWEGLVLPIEHEFWQTRYPPNDYRCRCRAVSVTEAEYARGGFMTSSLPPGLEGRERGKEGERKTVFHPFKTTLPPERNITFTNTRTGITVTVPEGVNPAFAYNVGMAGMRQAALAEAAGIKLTEAPAAIGAAFAQVTRSAMSQIFPDAVTRLVQETAKTMQSKGESVLIHVVVPEVVDAMEKQGHPLLTAGVWLTDDVLLHAIRETKAARVATLPQSTWENLPSLLNGAEVYLDTKDKRLLYVFSTATTPTGRVEKVAVAVNYTEKTRLAGTKHKRGKALANFIRTGGLVDADNISKDIRYIRLKE